MKPPSSSWVTGPRASCCRLARRRARTRLRCCTGHRQRLHLQRGLLCHVQAQNAGAQKAQSDLAASIMGTEVPRGIQPQQGLDSRAPEHGAWPSLTTAPRPPAKDFVATAKTGGLVPSVAHGMAIKPAAEGAIKDAVSQFWNDDKITVAAGMSATPPSAACDQVSVSAHCDGLRVSPTRAYALGVTPLSLLHAPKGMASGCKMPRHTRALRMQSMEDSRCPSW